MKYIFIENPAAGSQAGHDIYKKIKNSLKSNPDCEFYLTDEPGHATRVAREAARRFGSDCVIFACGGDGTLSEVATGAEGLGSYIALLPMGTGNDFAKKIYGNMTLEEIACGFGLLSGRPQVKTAHIDYLKANNTSCINVMSLGFDTKVLVLANKLSTKFSFLGSLSYKLALVASLFSNMCFKARFELEVADENGNISVIDETKEFTLAAICNASYYGGGFCPAKDSVLDDGLLNMVIAKKLNIIKVAQIVGSYSKGTAHITHPHLVKTKTLVGGRLSSVDGKPLIFNCDGNVFEAKTVDFKVVRNGFALAYFDNEAILAAINAREEIAV